MAVDTVMRVHDRSRGNEAITPHHEGIGVGLQRGNIDVTEKIIHDTQGTKPL